MKKIFIIGSDSFIARKFILSINDEYYIRSVARTNTGIKNELVIHDFGQISHDSFNDIDTVINFAAIVHRPDIKDEQIYNEVNNNLAILNARKAKHAGVKLFMQISTIAVYGNASSISFDTPINPQNPYAWSKLKADKVLLSMQDESFKVAIIRPPMVYGGGNSPGNMMRLIGLADKSIPLPFRDIDNKRDFINVNNLIQYLAIIAEKQLNGVFLITDQEPVSTEYLLLTISKYLGKKVCLVKLPRWILQTIKAIRPGEFDKLYGTLRIDSNFPYEDLINRFSVEDGIREMVDSFNSTKGY